VFVDADETQIAAGKRCAQEPDNSRADKVIADIRGYRGDQAYSQDLAPQGLVPELTASAVRGD
jgi:hypothetical protein